MPSLKLLKRSDASVKYLWFSNSRLCFFVLVKQFLSVHNPIFRSWRKAMRKVLALLVIVSVTLISACQSVSPDEEKAQFCADLTAYHAAVANLSALSADSTVDQFEAAAHAVAEARDDVSHSAYIVADAKTEA